MWERLDNLIDWDTVDAAVTLLVAWAERAAVIVAYPVALLWHIVEWIELAVGIGIGLFWLARVVGEIWEWFLATYC